MYSSDFVEENPDAADETLEGRDVDFEAEKLERFPSMKILVKKEGDKDEETSYFARWFETVPPNAPIREDEYHWPTGRALEPDFWTSDAKLDAYLGLNAPHEPRWESDSEDEEGPLTLSLNFTDDETDSVSSVADLDISRGDVERKSSVSSDEWSLDTISLDDDMMEVPSFSKMTSDWSQMPDLLPKISFNKVASPKPIARENSDWTQMPALLPPLHRQQSNLEAPSFEPTTSDWSVMPNLLPPLMTTYASDPSGWVPMPDNMVPTAVPQASWDTDFQAPQPRLKWMHENHDYSFTGSDEDPTFAHQSGSEYTREMEFLSSGANGSANAPAFALQQSYAPVGYHNGMDPLVNPSMMGMMQPETNALVQYQNPVTTTALGNNMVVARQPATIPPQFSFYYTGGVFHIILYHVPCGIFITPSKTATEVLLHVVFPVLYVHISGRAYTGFAHSYLTLDASYAESYYPTSTTFESRQAFDVTHVN